MDNLFKIIEVIDMGIEKEKARQDFYQNVASKFDDAELKDLFEKLAGWEEGHVKKFQAIRSEVDQDETTESYPGELTAYMQALVDDKLYNMLSADSFAEKLTSPFEAINHAIGFEKDAILLFLDLAELVPQAHKAPLLKLLEEERHHIVQLIKLRKKYE